MNNHQNIPTLKPIIPIPQLKYNEIGIRSDLKGYQIKNLIDKIIFFLIYKKYPTVTLKSRGKGIQKLISIIDILQRKILGLYVKQKTYSTSYVNNIDPNKEVKLPCMDSILTINEPNDKNENYLPLRKIEELENNFIDPKNPPDFRTIKGNNNNLNNYNNNNYNNNKGRGRGRGRIINRVNRGNLSFRPGFRGRGKLYNRGNRGRGFKVFRNNNNYGNFNNNNFNRRGQMRGRVIRKFNRGNNNIGFSNRNEDEDYREFKGYNNMNNNNFNRSSGNFNLNNNNNFGNHNFKNNRTENNFYSNNTNQSINNNNNINNFRKNNTQNNINNNINEKNNNNNNNNNDYNNKMIQNSNITNRGREGIPVARGRGQVLQMLGRGLPMRGKINNNENGNQIENTNIK